MLKVKNSSNIHNVNVTITNFDGEPELFKNNHLNNYTLFRGDEFSTNIAGGVRVMKVMHSDENGTPAGYSSIKDVKDESVGNNMWWSGLIPTNGSSTIFINPEKEIVTYGDRTLVNNISKNVKNIKNVDSNEWSTTTIIVIIIIIITILAGGFYIYKSKK
jgi:hypothetical protein